jgi:hypothetical protein
MAIIKWDNVGIPNTSKAVEQVINAQNGIGEAIKNAFTNPLEKYQEKVRTDRINNFGQTAANYADANGNINLDSFYADWVNDGGTSDDFLAAKTQYEAIQGIDKANAAATIRQAQQFELTKQARKLNSDQTINKRDTATDRAIQNLKSATSINVANQENKLKDKNSNGGVYDKTTYKSLHELVKKNESNDAGFAFGFGNDREDEAIVLNVISKFQGLGISAGVIHNVLDIYYEGGSYYNQLDQIKSMLNKVHSYKSSNPNLPDKQILQDLINTQYLRSAFTK